MTAFDRLPDGYIECSVCGTATKRTGHGQKFCRSCSRDRKREQSARWAREHRDETNSARVAAQREVRSHMPDAGKNLRPAATASGMIAPPDVILAWRHVLLLDWDGDLSKNRRWARGKDGVYVRSGAAAATEALAVRVKSAIGGQVVHNRLWLDITAWKPNHKHDVVNLVDSVCDAIKLVTPMDDNWFCFRWIQWHVDRDNPRIALGIGQEDVPDALVCSRCGRVLPLDKFSRRRNGPMGRQRECRECCAEARRLHREAKDQESS